MNAYTGSARSLVRIRLRLVPLTPVHIGDGTDLWPNEYLLEEPAPANTRNDEYGEEIATNVAPSSPMLCRFNPVKATRLMTTAQRQTFQAALDEGRLANAARALREAGKGAIIERVPVSSRSAAELRQAFADPQSRSGQVKPFIRSGGRPYIPGSSIKGAFRTALASAFLPRDNTYPADSWTHERAMQEAFALEPGKTETDPLRFLHVSDAALPDNATLIDRVEVMARSNPRRSMIQMHYEIVPGRALLPQSRLSWDVWISIDQRAPFDGAKLLKLTSGFHWEIWRKERQYFFADATGTQQAMDRLLKTVKVKGGTLADRGFAEAPNYVLLRLGRFGHFESKSLDGVRRGYFPQARDPEKRRRAPDEWGTTRTVTRDAHGNPIPFGWVIGWVVKERQP